MPVPPFGDLATLKSGQDVSKSAMIASKMRFNWLSELSWTHQELQDHILHRI